MPTTKTRPFLRDPGTWRQRLGERDLSGRPALFLDRDGVIVEEVNYLHRIDDVRIFPGVAEAIATAHALDVAVVVVTNQAGIGRGYYSWEQFAEVQDHILEELGKAGAAVDLVLACAYHKDGLNELGAEDHAWRKPGPGMVLEAEKSLGIALGASHIIGDTLTDMQAGFRAGLPGGTLVLTGHGTRDRELHSAALQDLQRQGFALDYCDQPGVAIMRWLANVEHRFR